MSVSLGVKNKGLQKLGLTPEKSGMPREGSVPNFSVESGLSQNNSTRDNLVETLANLINLTEAKFPFWHDHSVMVTMCAINVAHEMNLEEDFIERLRDAGRLHDIGKVLLSEKILSKQESLTDRDWRLVRMHPDWGKMILAPFMELKGILPLVYYHHELYDGSGYPEGLKGEAIPLGARILALADAYVIMSAGQSSCSGVHNGLVLSGIKEFSGVRFDPAAVAALLRIQANQSGPR